MDRLNLAEYIIEYKGQTYFNEISIQLIRHAQAFTEALTQYKNNTQNAVIMDREFIEGLIVILEKAADVCNHDPVDSMGDDA